MFFNYEDGAKLLTVTTTFSVKERLSDDEIGFLIEDTLGQWSDGMGENFVGESEDKYGYSIMCLDRSEFDGTHHPNIVIV